MFIYINDKRELSTEEIIIAEYGTRVITKCKLSKKAMEIVQMLIKGRDF
jgi:hypothetical protein